VVRTVVLARHGESVANVEHRFANRALGPPLTATGQDQADALARSLSGQGIGLVVTSPLLRARGTARVVAHALGVPLEVAEALREYDVGTFEGSTDAAHWAAYERTEAAWDAGEWTARTGGGESLAEIEERLTGWFTEVRGRPAPDAVLAVSHGGVLRRLLPRVVRPQDAGLVRGLTLATTGYVVLALPDDPSSPAAVVHV
jgi:broad specificity phosphatase PhoE